MEERRECRKEESHCGGGRSVGGKASGEVYVKGENRVVEQILSASWGNNTVSGLRVTSRRKKSK